VSEDTSDDTADAVGLTVVDGDEEAVLSVASGTTLRDALLANGFSPHGSVSRVTNCGGRGLCGTCGVRVDDPPAPDHWHDGLSERWGYPRLSCQLTVEDDMRVELVEKVVWGQLLPDYSQGARSP